MTGTVIDTVLNITANVNGQQAVEAMRSGIGGLATVYDRVKLAQEGLITGLRGLAAAASAGVLANIVKGTIEYGDALDLASEKTGIGAADLAKWGVAAEEAGKSLDTVIIGFKNMSKSLIEASAGNEKLDAAFRALGLNVSTLLKENPNQAMLQIADAFAKMPDGMVKAGLAMEIFKKSGVDMIPIMDEGRAAIEGISTAVTQDFADMAHIFSDNMILLKNDTQNLKVGFTDGLLPALIDITNAFRDFNTEGTLMNTLGSLLGEMFRGWAIILLSLGATLKDIFALIGFVGAGMNDVITGKFSQLPALVKELDTSIETNKQHLIQSLDDIAAHDPMNPNATPIKRQKTSHGSTDAALAAMQGVNPKEKTFESEMEKLKATGQEQIQALIDERDQVGLTAAAIANLKDQRETEKSIREKVIGMTPEQTSAYRSEAESLLTVRDNLRLTNEEQARTFDSGLQSWTAKYTQAVTDTASNTSSIMQKSFDGMSQSLTNFVEGGKMNFGQLVQSILNDLIQMEIKSAVLGPIAGMLFGGGGNGEPLPGTVGPTQPSTGIFGGIKSFFGSLFADGGVMTSLGPATLRKYASGGVANSPQLAMYGEGSGPEAYVPLPDGRSIPVALSGGGSGGDTNIAIHFHGMDDAGATVGGRGPNANQAQQLGVMLSSTVKAVLVNEKRPGGILSNSPAGAS